MQNPILAADAYTIASNCLVSKEARQCSRYYMANRTSPMRAWPEVAKSDKMVMFSGMFKLYDITPANLVEAVDFMSHAHLFNRPLKFDFEMWNRVLKEYGGRPPIHIEAIPNGSVFYPHQPMVQVTSLSKGFGEIAAHIEALLVGQVSISTARATLTAHLFQFMVDQIKKYNPNLKQEERINIARNLVHDFGMRASSTYEESLNLGMAHLLFFNGTDTFSAAGLAYKNSKNPIFGKSILALAHRVVQSYENEEDAYKNLMEQDSIGSYVADCYDFKRAVINHLIPLAKENPSKVVVIRPDSGNAVENVTFIVKVAIASGLYKDGPNGYEPTNVMFIEGNTVTPKVINDVYEAVSKLGANPTKWGLFGIGGWLRNSCTRDSLSSAYKLNAVGLNGHSRPVMKFSETEEKESIPGPIKLVNRVCHKKTSLEEAEITRRTIVQSDYTDFVTMYDGSTNYSYVPHGPAFDIVRNRANYQWFTSPESMERDAIVGEMKDTVKMLRKKYK